jgi:hypothetical protein
LRRLNGTVFALISVFSPGLNDSTISEDSQCETLYNWGTDMTGAMVTRPVPEDAESSDDAEGASALGTDPIFYTIRMLFYTIRNTKK